MAKSLKLANEHKTKLDKIHSNSFSMGSKSLTTTPTKTSFRSAAHKLVNRKITALFQSDPTMPAPQPSPQQSVTTNPGVKAGATADEVGLCVGCSRKCKINTNPHGSGSSGIKKQNSPASDRKSSSLDSTPRNNIFCRRYRSSFYENKTPLNNSPSSSWHGSPSRRRGDVAEHSTKYNDDAITYNDLNARMKIMSIRNSPTLTANGVSHKKAVSGRTTTSSDLLRKKRQQFSAKPKVFFKCQREDEFLQSRR